MPPPTRRDHRRPPPHTPPPGHAARRRHGHAARTGGGQRGVLAGRADWPSPDELLAELEILDQLAQRVTGDLINAGIAAIDTLWSVGADLTPALTTYLHLAHRASPQYTGGLWALIAWIHWRTGNRQEAWPALRLAHHDPDIDAAHHLTVYLHARVDPHAVPPITYRSSQPG